MIYLFIAFAIVCILLIIYSLAKYTRARQFLYVSPFELKNEIKQKIANKNPEFLRQLHDFKNVDKLLELKSLTFVNSFSLGLEQRKENKPEFYEDLIEALNSYILYFLIYIDLSKKTGSITDWKALEKSWKELDLKIQKVEPFIASKITNKSKNTLYLLQKSLIMYIEDFKKLKDLLHK